MIPIFGASVRRLSQGTSANHLRCLKHNLFERNPFSMRYRKGIFILEYPSFTLGFHENPFNDLALEGVGYFLRRRIQPDDIIVDAGAYAGAITVLMATQTGPKGRVVAFEPDPENAARLRANVLLNGLENVTILEKALWDRPGASAWCGFGRPDAHAIPGTEDATAPQVELTTLDQALEALGIEQIDFLKADIEGAELRALQGSQNVLRNSRAHLAIASYHNAGEGPTAPHVESLLRTMGYHSETGNPSHLTTWGWR